MLTQRRTDLAKNSHVSIITVTRNCSKTIQDTISSVVSQDYPYIEHIVVDGASTDGTQAIVRRNLNTIKHFISEPDTGIYNAMNKGIRLATGSIVGILNGDDVYFDSTCVSAVVEEFEKSMVDAVYGNLIYVPSDDLNRIVRYYNSEAFHPRMFEDGHMPAHPTFFVRKECYEKYGLFKEDYLIASDFELLLRFLGSNKLSFSCIPRTLVKMRVGGVSTRSIKSNWILNKEIVRACRENNVKTNMAKVLLKYPQKITQLIYRPKN